jgi:hypothetical protein
MSTGSNFLGAGTNCLRGGQIVIAWTRERGEGKEVKEVK